MGINFGSHRYYHKPVATFVVRLFTKKEANQTDSFFRKIMKKIKNYSIVMYLKYPSATV